VQSGVIRGDLTHPVHPHTDAFINHNGQSYLWSPAPAESRLLGHCIDDPARRTYAERMRPAKSVFDWTAELPDRIDSR